MPKPYPKEFRDDVVRVARSREPGVTLEQVAADFGIHVMTLSNWIKKADIEDGRRDGVSEAESADLRDARRRIRLLEQENEVLRRKYRLNRLLVMKLDPAEMTDDTRARSAEGVLVFSALCTHRACTIKSWMADERHMRCHCHLSQFAALDEGRVMNGPAKRHLPMVPVAIDEEGYVVATDTFTAKPGGAKK